MDQQTPTPNPSSSATTAISSVSASTPSTPSAPSTATPTPTTTADASQPTEPSPAQPSPAPQSQLSQPPSFTATPTTSITISTLPPPAPNPNPNPPPRPIHSVASTTTNISSSVVAARPQLIHRPWQHPHPHSHFSQLSSSISPPIPSPQPRGSVAIGVPASHPTPSPPSFSSSFSQQFTGLSRGPVNVADSVANASNAQMRMMGPMSSSTSMRPAGISVHHQPRPGVQASLRPSPSPQPPSPSNQTPTTQNFQGHGFMRSSSPGPPVSPVTTTPQRPLSVGPIGSPAPSTSLRPALGGPPAPNASQSMQSPNQPWLSTVSQGKPPLPSPSYRPSMNPPPMQQRPHIPSQHHSVTTSSQQQHMASTQPQPLPSNQPPDHFGQQFPPSRGPQSLPHQQQLSRGQVTTHQKSSPLAAVQPNTVQPVLQNRIASTERDESGNRILSKRSIHELVSQIDPLERLDREVEDILADIADEFVESITTFGCSLAKHRKSNTLEAKDILLHLEMNWNITLPGFGGDEIKTYRKPLTNDTHKERLAAVKKSIVASEVASAKNPVGQASANAKSNMAKTPANTMVSPNLKVT